MAFERLSRTYGRTGAIASELRSHAPFTVFGALTGIVCMLVFRGLSEPVTHRLFYVFHPAHVLLSAMVTAAMFRRHSSRAKVLAVVVIGYVGSIGIATLSDSVVPYLGELLIGFEPHAHIGFIEGWYVVNPAAFVGIAIAWRWPATRFPHWGHVLVSTWASSFHMLMAVTGQLSAWGLAGSFLFLFLAVWLPCCISDIVFPLIFAQKVVGSQEQVQEKGCS